MNEYKEMAIRALQGQKGDDTYRARKAFSGLSEEEMNKEHGFSGKTRKEFLEEYTQSDAKIDKAIEWLRSL